jgi:hypothetical protein
MYSVDFFTGCDIFFTSETKDKEKLILWKKIISCGVALDSLQKQAAKRCSLTQMEFSD